MTMFHAMNITASALTAQRLRMDVTSSNMANLETTRATQVNGEWQPYRRKMVVMEPKGDSFKTMFNRELQGETGGVHIKRIIEDQTPFKLTFQPGHPDANADGYVQLPNIDPLKEMVDLMSATRSYEANITVFNANKNLLAKSLEIGK